MSRPASPQKVSQIVAHLTGCLALIRPVGMTDGEGDDWLASGAKTLADFPLSDVALACAEARRECTHYRETVAFVAKRCEALASKRSRLAEWSEPVKRLPKPRMSQEDFDRIVAERGRALSVALDRGDIIRTETGFERA